MVVIDGVSASHMPVSQTSARSARSASRLAATKAGRDGEPDSSSPSNSTVTSQGRPPVSRKARQASTKVMSWPLSSEAPRATMRPPSCSSGLNGIGVPQVERVDRLHVVMAVEQHVRRVAVRRLGVAEHHGSARRGVHLRLEAERRSARARASPRRARTAAHRRRRSRWRGWPAARTAGRARPGGSGRWSAGRRRSRPWGLPGRTGVGGWLTSRPGHRTGANRRERTQKSPARGEPGSMDRDRRAQKMRLNTR